MSFIGRTVWQLNGRCYACHCIPTRGSRNCSRLRNFARTHVQRRMRTRKGARVSDKLINPRNWTFATPEIYLSDLHDDKQSSAAIQTQVCVLFCLFIYSLKKNDYLCR